MDQAPEGWVDRVENGHVVGWAWWPDRPDLVAEIEVWIEGKVRARTMANVFRGDLQSAGKRDGRCGFAIPVGGLTGEAIVGVRSVGGPIELGGGAVRLEAQAGDLAPAAASSTQVASGPAGPAMLGGLDTLGPLEISGWIQDPAAPSEKLRLELIADGEPVLRFQADQWRTDVEELRQGDGRWGFRAPFPAALRDGRPHRLQLRVAGRDGVSMGGPVERTFPAVDVAAAPPAACPGPSADPAPRAHRPAGAPELSVIVNFYNMRREAERTLHSLSRLYQRGVDDLDYEVICVDNGSAEPLSAEWVAGFGPQFRLFRPARPQPSPCVAINAAAREARGVRLALMIDGAHVLTPGVLAEAVAQMRADPAAVVALRHWFVGGDQRWLASAGYSPEMEDLLFDRISWPRDGYDLFLIGAPIGESPNAWLDGLSESNCLFTPAEVWRQIGGFDEAFVEPGGGFANLDLFKRAAAAAAGGVVCLIGEATFHQYHGGSTTNVDEQEKDRRVTAYALDYRVLRGEAFEALKPGAFRLAGRMRSRFATTARQRPSYPAPVGVTGLIRPADRRRLLDPGAERYIQGAYVELGLDRVARWLGAPVSLAPNDLISILEVMREVRPVSIVTTSAEPGLHAFLDDACRLLALDGSQVVLASARPVEGLPSRTSVVSGDPWARQTLREVERRLETAEEVMVLFEPPPGPGAPVEALAAYAELVSYESYIIYLGAARGQPWLGYSDRWPMTAVRVLTRPGSRYAVDHTHDQHFVTACPSGYIRRIGGRVEPGLNDAGLDLLDAL